MSIFDRFKLTGKRLFITGGSRGLGREMAVAIADAGADVILVGRDQASLEKTAGDIRALGRQAWTIAADVGKPAECEQACQSALERHGPIDILINNVGGRRENIPTEAMSLDKWRELIDLNLTSPSSPRRRSRRRPWTKRPQGTNVQWIPRLLGLGRSPV